MITKKNIKKIPKENINKNNLNWPQIFDHPYRIFIIGGFGSEKTNALLNLIKQQDDDDHSITDKIYLYMKDLYEAKNQYLIKKRECNGLKNLKDPKTFTEYSNNMENVYKNIEEYNPSRKYNVLIVFDHMICNQKLIPIVT